MKHRKLKILLAGIWIGVTAFTLAVPAIPAYAIADPDSFGINAIYAYRHCLEDDDQLYLVDYTISYAANPTENATEAFIFRLMNGAVELGNTVPYSYYDEGYGRGIISIYFSAAEAPAWNGAYTMTLIGNPTLTWVADPPETSVGTFTSWSSSTSQSATELELSSRVLYLADLLELAWSVDLIETASTGSWLTDYGVEYFTNSIDDLQELCPAIFSSSVSKPTYPDKEYGASTYAAGLRAAIVGTPLDLSALAPIVGISTIWLTTAIWIGIMAVVGWGVAKKTGSTKPVLIVLAAFIPIGVMIGWLDLIVAILMGFAAIIAVAYAFFLQKSSA